MDGKLQIGERARQAIDDMLASDPVEEASLVIQPGDGDACCTAGFEVLLVSRREIPSEDYRIVGEQHGLPVYVFRDLSPPPRSRIVINQDHVTGQLAAMFLPEK